jgi:hypothetical protein
MHGRSATEAYTDLPFRPSGAILPEITGGLRGPAGTSGESRRPLAPHYVGPSPRHDPYQPFMGKYREGAPDRRWGQPCLSHDVNDRRQLLPGGILAAGDPVPDDRRELLERELGGIMIDLHSHSVAGQSI